MAVVIPMKKPDKRIGRQTPTREVILPFGKTLADEAIKLYGQSGRKAYEWQAHLLNAILAVNRDGLWTHVKFGFSVPRQNGKNEVIAMRELFGLKKGERILHTATGQPQVPLPLTDCLKLWKKPDWKKASTIQK